MVPTVGFMADWLVRRHRLTVLMAGMDPTPLPENPDVAAALVSGLLEVGIVPAAPVPTDADLAEIPQASVLRFLDWSEIQWMTAILGNVRAKVTQDANLGSRDLSDTAKSLEAELKRRVQAYQGRRDQGDQAMAGAGFWGGGSTRPYVHDSEIWYRMTGIDP